MAKIGGLIKMDFKKVMKETANKINKVREEQGFILVVPNAVTGNNQPNETALFNAIKSNNKKEA